MRGTMFIILPAGLATAAGLAVAAALFRPAADPGAVQPLSSLSGEVTAVDGQSITVRGFGGVRVSAEQGAQYEHHPTGARSVTTGKAVEVTLPGREVVCARVEVTRATITMTHPGGEVEVVHRADQPARRLPAAGPLAQGRYDTREPAAALTYRLADIKVGDEVYVRCERVNGADYCTRIQINRRPGGEVPPAPGQKPDDPRPHHVRVNAEQAFEERGIPLPEEFDRVAQMRRQREEHEQQVRAKIAEAATRRAGERTAPPPREARPRPPAP